MTLFPVLLLHLSLWDKHCNNPERSRHVKDQLSFTLSPWTLLLMPEQDQYLQPTLEHHSY